MPSPVSLATLAPAMVLPLRIPLRSGSLHGLKLVGLRLMAPCVKVQRPAIIKDDDDVQATTGSLLGF